MAEEMCLGCSLHCPSWELTDLEQRVLRLRFNTRGSEAMSMRAVAEKLGMSYQDVRAALRSGERKFPTYHGFVDWLRRPAP